MANTAVVGVNWGDEGKGRIVDYLARDADLVVRFQGGNNAGHTIVNERGTFKLHLVPSGVFDPDIVNILGPGMVVDLQGLDEELAHLRVRGIAAENVRLSERATICFPYHRCEDAWEEERLGRDAYGSTRRGIAPAYADRYAKKAVQIGEILRPELLRPRLQEIVAWKNLQLRGLTGQERSISFDETWEWLTAWGERIRPRIIETAELMRLASGRRVLFEAQLGALRDVVYGISPYTSSSPVLAGYAPVGGGLPDTRIDTVVGVMKAFSTLVGAGPFVTEMASEEADRLRETAEEYGAATGRPRRIGHFDAVASRYGAAVQGADTIALTKLDSLTGRGELLICTHYECDERRLDSFPLADPLDRCRPVYESLPGWTEDITGIRRFEDLPANARAYVRRIEELVGRPIGYISVGPEREQMIRKE